MNTTTQKIESILARSTKAIWINSRGEGVIVGIPITKKDGSLFPLSCFYRRENGEFVFLRIASE